MRKERIDRYVCPFCCKAVDPERFHRVCTDPNCARIFADRCSPAERARRISTFHAGEEIDVEKSLVMGIDPRSSDAITTRNHIVYPVKTRKCDVCGTDLPDALCPYCHSPVPSDAENGSNIIAVLGASRSGKSHYTASLIDVMKTSYCSEYGATMTPAVPRTETVFNILKTRLATGAYDTECTSEPMVYYLTDDNGGVKHVHTLALFDTAGADMESEGPLQSVATGTLITGAAGILFVVDPLSLPDVRRRLGMPEIKVPDPASRLNEIADTIRLRRHQMSQNIDVPLAIIISKVDALMKTPDNPDEEKVIFGPESALNIPRVRGTYDEENLMQISDEVEEYLRRYAGERFMNAVDRFRPHAFFAVSALGHDAGIHIDPEPFRVEDPMIWMFNHKEK